MKEIAIDPVCQMEVDTQTAKFVSHYNGTTYYFCAPGCKHDFEEEPQAYANQDSQVEKNHGHLH